MKSKVADHFNKIAPKYDFYTKKRDLHYSTLKKLLRSLIPPGKKVLEVGCGTGDLVASLSPKEGYGQDISSEMIKIANVKHSNDRQIYFSTRWPTGKFDYIFMSDVVEHLESPKETFRKILTLMSPKTIFINTMMNPIWIPVETVYNSFGWKMPEGPHHRIKYKELKLIVEKAGMKIVKHDYKLLIPIRIPFITSYANRHLEKYLKPLAFIEFFEAVLK